MPVAASVGGSRARWPARASTEPDDGSPAAPAPEPAVQGAERSPRAAVAPAPAARAAERAPPAAEGMPRVVLNRWAEAVRKTEPLELWGSSELFGAFVPEAGEPGQTPVYRRKEDDSTVLFVGEHGHWWIGTSGDGGRVKEGSVRSQRPVAPGTLPDSIAWWSEKGPNARSETGLQDWRHSVFLRFHTPEAVAAEWRKARERAATHIMLSLSGSPVDLAYDGLYYVVEDGREDGPPCFKTQTSPERWVCLGAHGRWWAGAKECIASALTEGLLRTNPVGPGVLPFAGTVQWQSWDSGSEAWVAQPRTHFRNLPQECVPPEATAAAPPRGCAKLRRRVKQFGLPAWPVEPVELSSSACQH